MFKSLLVPLDRSPLAEQAIGRAASIARAANSRLDLTLVHQPLPFGGFTDAPWDDDHLKDDERYLKAIAAELSTGAAIAASHAVISGEPVEMICARVREVDADLIVMTSHGRTGLSRAWIGSIADGVLRKSMVPVLMLRPVASGYEQRLAAKPFAKILVTLDGSALSLEVLPAAAKLARMSQAHVSLLRIVPPVPLITPEVNAPFMYAAALQDMPATVRLVAEAEHELAEVAATLREQGIAHVGTTVVVHDNTSQAIIDYARGQSVDAIAMATHGRGASRLIIGSVADKVRRVTELPVLVHRPALIHAQPLALTEEAMADELPALR